MHYTHRKTKDFLMVTVIQGFGYQLIDPEIASSDAQDQNSNWNFTPGNCSLNGYYKVL